MNNVNVLIKWNKALNKLGETLELNAVNFKMVKPGGKFHATLDEFKVGKIIQSTTHCFIITATNIYHVGYLNVIRLFCLLSTDGFENKRIVNDTEFDF